MADSVEVLKEKLALTQQEAKFYETLARMQADVIRETIPMYEIYERSMKKGSKKVMLKHELFFPYCGAMIELIEFNKDAEKKGRERGLKQVNKAVEDYKKVKLNS